MNADDKVINLEAHRAALAAVDDLVILKPGAYTAAYVSHEARSAFGGPKLKVLFQLYEHCELVLWWGSCAIRRERYFGRAPSLVIRDGTNVMCPASTFGSNDRTAVRCPGDLTSAITM
jgi:hypothetical protein